VLGLRSVQALVGRDSQPGWRFTRTLALLLCIPTSASEVVYLREAGRAHQAIRDAMDPLAARWMRTFAVRTDYSVSEFLAVCGRQYTDQYFSRRPPSITRDER
jgi:hypothetical protein